MSWQGLYGRSFPLQRPYTPLIFTSARRINPMIQAINNLHRRRVNPGLISIEAAGIKNEVGIGTEEVYARLIATSGSGGAYTWQGITGDPAGSTWLDLPAIVSDNGGVDLAYEANGNSALTLPVRVFLRRESGSGRYVFIYGTCP
jgi:hypothetical protein